MYKTSIIDVPKKAHEEDLLGIDKYKLGLVRFIESTNTPITVAIQGEWGSGKTSLMNTLRDELCDQDGKKFIPVWLNTWQYSLMKEPEQALISIIKGLTDEVLAIIDEKKSDVGKKVRSVFANVLRATAKVAVSATTGQDIGEIIDATSVSKEVTILQLRNSLNDAIADILNNENKDGFIFFIDDLDRIDPPMAVQILELLKNIFDLDSCVFVLAIDYDVVIKGLEPKFGKYTESNEREFRSFFDKIIQLPFSMPTSSYDINEFLVKSLEIINYIDSEQVKDEEFTSNLSEITRLSVGSNPRSLKRLLNSLSLINCINYDENEDDDNPINTIVGYALVNIQVAYPAIYSLLVKSPDFSIWGEKFAMQLNLPQINDEIKLKLEGQEEFDEEWEQILFRVCERDIFLKKMALPISQLLNKIKSIIPDSMDLGEIIENSISLSAVTSVEAFDKPLLSFNASNFLRSMIELLIPNLNNRLGERSKVICKQKRFSKHAMIDFELEEYRNWIKFTPVGTNDGIKLVFYTERSILIKSSKNSDFSEEIKTNGMEDFIDSMHANLTDFCAQHPIFSLAVRNGDTDLRKAVWKYKDRWVLSPSLITLLKKAEDVKSEEFIDQLSQACEALFECLLKMNLEHKNRVVAG